MLYLCTAIKGLLLHRDRTSGILTLQGKVPIERCQNKTLGWFGGPTPVWKGDLGFVCLFLT